MDIRESSEYCRIEYYRIKRNDRPLIYSFQIRYRLVRHMWQLNVNESLCMGASCSIGNMATGELGVDINIKNLNQVHHPLMTEIMLNDISLFSPTYQINSKKVICRCQYNCNVIVRSI